MVTTRIAARDVPPRSAWALEQAGVHPLLARLFAARGVKHADELDDALARLLPPAGLLGAGAAAELLADAIGAGSRICVVADYDCDGATACAVMLRGLKMLGASAANLGYVVPDRRVHGYGLTPAIVDLALAASPGSPPDVLVTVDNGIASLEGVAHARAAGLAVVVTDHHLPARVNEAVVLPDADVIVNPNQPGCSFASKNLAGVGVAFYVLLMLRAELRERGVYEAPTLPPVAAPRGGAAGLGSGPAPGQAPTLPPVAAPRGGAAGLGSGPAPGQAPTLPPVAAPRGGAAGLGSGPAPGQAPTLPPVAAPRGGAAGLGSGPAPGQAPTLPSVAAPRGGAAGLGSGPAPGQAPTLPPVAAPRGGAAGLGSGPAPGRPPVQPRLDALLDLVALGTVADVVRLDRNNRCLVAQGLKRIRAGRLQPGLAALFAVAGRDPAEASAADFGFALGPRLNAAGRLADMTLGIECLLTDDPGRAHELATALDAMNRERRHLEAGMRDEAEAQVDRAIALTGEIEPALAVFDASFHEGVVGIIASRLKDRAHRPCFVFALGQDGQLKGSGRSIEGFHLRDALDLVSKRHPQLLKRFGGHAMAAGCTIALDDLATFRAALHEIAALGLGAASNERTVPSDGPLDARHFDAATVRVIEAQVWGPTFDAPVFSDAVEIVSQRLVGEKHLKLAVRVGGVVRDAIWFGRSEPVGDHVRLAWRLGLDAYNGIERVQLVVVAAE